MKKRKNKKLTTNILYGVAALLLFGAVCGTLNALVNPKDEDKHICNNYTISDDAIIFDFKQLRQDNENGGYFTLADEDIQNRFNSAVEAKHNDYDGVLPFVDAKLLPEYVDLYVDQLNVGTTYSVSIILSCSNYDSLSEYIDGSISLTAFNYEDGGSFGNVDVDSLNIKNEKNTCEFAEFNFRKIKLFDATYNYNPENYTAITFHKNDIPEDEYLYLASIVLEPIESTTYNLRSLNSNTSEEVINYHNDDEETQCHIEWGPLS